jgi:hypothetical protein
MALGYGLIVLPFCLPAENSKRSFAQGNLIQISEVIIDFFAFICYYSV